VTVTFADGLGRVLQTKKGLERDTGTGMEVGMTVSGAVAFDALGRVVEQGQPGFSAESDTAFVSLGLLRSTKLTPDVFSRIREAATPDTSAPGGYAQTAIERDLVALEGQLLFQEMVIDANAKMRNTYRDVGGRIAAVEEFTRIKGGDADRDALSAQPARRARAGDRRAQQRHAGDVRHRGPHGRAGEP
jgi:hypothetical protein